MKTKDYYLDPLGSSKQSQVRNLVQFRVALASTSFMHKHFPSEQTFLCGTNHASRACQQRTKTEMKECTHLQIQKAHTLASLGKLCTKAPTEWGEKRKLCQCFPRRHARGLGECAWGSAGLRVCWGQACCRKNNPVLLDGAGSYAQWMLCFQIKFNS